MNDSEFEDQLRALKPGGSRSQLEQRIERELNAARGPAESTVCAGILRRTGGKAGTGRWGRDVLWALAGAAAALMSMTLFSARESSISKPALVTSDRRAAVRADRDFSSDQNLAATERFGREDRLAAAEPADDADRTADSPQIAESAFEPAGTISELLAADESGQLIETADGPVREVRYSFRERHAWMNPRTGARMELEVPRHDVYRLPVSLQ